MDTDTLLAVLIGLLGALGAFFGALTGGRVSLATTKMNLEHQMEQVRIGQQEARRTARQEYLSNLMLRLLEACEEYEQYLAQNPVGRDKKLEDPVWHAKVIGKAMAACLAATDAHDNLADLLEALAVAADNEHAEEYRARAKQYGETLAYIALRRLTRNFVDNPDWLEVQVWGGYKDRNREALNDAMRVLAVRIADLQ